MSIAVLYIVLISVSCSLAFVHFIIWIRLRKRIYSLLFTLVALSSGTLSVLEFRLFGLNNSEVYMHIMKYYHLFLFSFLVTLVWFIYDYFGTANRNLAILFTALWIVAISINFMVEGNITFYEIEAFAQRQAFTGEVFYHPIVSPNPWRHIADAASILFVIYILLATLKLFKKGNKERALSVGGSALIFILISGTLAPLIDVSILKLPTIVSAPFVLMVLAMSFELIADVVNGAKLAVRLSAEKSKWQNLLEEINLPVVIVDIEGMVEYVNPCLKTILGYTGEEILGKNWIELVVPEKERSDIVKNFSLPVTKGFPAHYENRVLTKHAEERLLAWSNVGIYNEKDQLTGITAVGSDITQRKRAFEQIIELKNQLEIENLILKQNLSNSPSTSEIITESKATIYAFEKARQVASVDSTVLLEGETGVGKGVFAKYIHKNSSRNKKPLVVVNCAALPAELLESELFGYEKGAFTGATKQKKGRFELADGGTLFLDEIADLPLELQPKLLRVIQDGTFERLGGEKTLSVNVRIITATNKVLVDQVKANRFREDLFYRLNVFPITIPPLRKRKEDIPRLIDHFVGVFNKKYTKNITHISKQTYATFSQYHWPGNVRELQNIIERAVITAQGEVLKTNGLIPKATTHETAKSNTIIKLEELEREHIISALKACNWQIHGEEGAALALGLNPSTLRSRMKKLGIEKTPHLQA
jgi:PAS domain S-box-containing protein